MKIKMTADDFKRGMAAATKNVAVRREAEIRPILGRVSIRVYNPEDKVGNVEMVGMDGYVLACAYFPCNVIDFCEDDMRKDYHEFLIEPVSVPRGTSFVMIRDDEDSIWIEFDGASMIKQKKLNGEFVDYQKIMMTSEPEFRIAFNPKYLERAIHACKDEDVVTLHFFDGVKPVQIDGEHIRTLCLPVRMMSDGNGGIVTAMRNRMENHR